jgi:L-threonylcarbamoyladenylate synthase
MIVLAADDAAFGTLVKSLSSGGVAIIPCDTMYGIVGVAPQTEERIRQIKGRGETKPFLQLIGSASWVSRFSDLALPPVLSKYWPGPLTLVFPHRAGGTVAVRLPDSLLLRRLLEAIGQPLYSTSVNKTGKPPLVEVAAMKQEFERDVDLIFDAGNLPPGPPSTLVDITNRPYRVLRAGVVQIPEAELV